MDRYGPTDPRCEHFLAEDRDQEYPAEQNTQAGHSQQNEKYRYIPVQHPLEAGPTWNGLIGSTGFNSHPSADGVDDNERE
jgi:hypothetical protein